MHFDDRLATVLRHRASGELAARTQYRQLLDLLGEPPRDRDESLEAAAFLRLDALSKAIPLEHRARIVGEGGARIRNAGLVAWLGEAEADIAAAALARASLSGEEWSRLIPALPIRARGFLRHRTSLPEEATAILDRLGVQDRVLPEPLESGTPAKEAEPADHLELTEELEDIKADDTAMPAPKTGPAEEPGPAGEPARKTDDDKPRIGELVRRIEAFSKAREARNVAPGEQGEEAPRLPLGEESVGNVKARAKAFSFSTDSDGRIDWAEAKIAPMVVGTMLTQDVRAVTDLAKALRNRQPISGARVELAGAPAIAGDWMIDASPRFTQRDGRFAGHIGRFRRITENSMQLRAAAEADRVRELLHELRTPVNAIQGFAEVIQQQLFGETPHEYRALAASIAGDSARMLAGFDELDRLVKMESGALTPDEGLCDFLAIARRQVEQLQSALSSRVVRFEAVWPTGRAMLPIDQRDGEKLAWRVLGTLAAATSAGECLPLSFALEGDQLSLTCGLPTSLAAAQDIFSTETRPTTNALSPGIFGAGFSLRLARAETRASGGELAREEDRLVLSLPLLTALEGEPNPEQEPDHATG